MVSQNYVFVHAGMEKCASSSIHSCLTESKEYLESNHLKFIDTYKLPDTEELNSDFLYLIQSRMTNPNLSYILSRRSLYSQPKSIHAIRNMVKSVLPNHRIVIIFFIPRIDSWYKKLRHTELKKLTPVSKHPNIQNVYNMGFLIEELKKENDLSVVTRAYSKSSNGIEELSSIVSSFLGREINLPSSYRRNTNHVSYSADSFLQELLSEDLNLSAATKKEILPIVLSSFSDTPNLGKLPPIEEIIHKIDGVCEGYKDIYDSPLDFGLSSKDDNKASMLMLTRLVILAIEKINSASSAESLASK